MTDSTPALPVREAAFTLTSLVLPRVTETVAVAERVRRKLMGIHRALCGGDPTAVSPRFSGKNPDGTFLRGHQHAFFWPRDGDGDGRLDTLWVRAHDPFTPDELAAFDRLRSLWQPDGAADIHLTPTALRDVPAAESSVRFVSATPFVTRRNHRPGRGAFLDWLAGEVVRECEVRGLPRPLALRWTDAPPTAAPDLGWFAFQRGRTGEHPRPGYGCELTFDSPVSGPFALGSGAHFGLGLFVAA